MSVTNAAFASTHMPLPDRVRWQAGNLLIGELFGRQALDDLRDTFSRSLVCWLKRRGIRGADLARLLDTTRSSVSRWLNAEAETDFGGLARIARALNIPAWYLIHPNPEDLPDPANGTKAKPDEVEEALKILGAKAGYKVRLEPLKRT